MLICACLAVTLAWRFRERESTEKDTVRGAQAAGQNAAATASARRRADAIRAQLEDRYPTKTNHQLQNVGNAGNPDISNTFGAQSARGLQPMPAPVGSGNQVDQPLGAYIREVMKKQFLPLGASCYETLSRKYPDAAGSILLDVTIIGDRSVGGVVDSVKIDESPSLKDDQLITCVRESMYAVVFQPPPDGQPRVTFTMPLDFSPDPPDAAPSRM